MKKIIGLICTVALVLSCMTAMFGMSVSAATAVTLNNNGVITTENLEAGAALEAPTSDLENNVFLGWYTDTTWATKVETVPAEATTLYAKWSKTYVAFNNLTSRSAVHMAVNAEMEDGAWKVNFNASNIKRNIVVPAYDAADASKYMFEEGKDYKITFDYKIPAAVDHSTTNRGFYYSFVTGEGDERVQQGQIAAQKFINRVEQTECFVTHTLELNNVAIDDSFTTDTAAGISFTWNIYGNGNYAYFDNFIIEEVIPSSNVTLNNNGVITTEKILEGGTLPTPASDIEGNKFLGWYTDAQCTTAVTTIEDGATYYAKWTTTVIDFNNITSKSGINGYSQAKITDGVLYSVCSTNYPTYIPAYDTNNAGNYLFENGKSYKVTLTYYATAIDRNLGWGYCGDVKTTATRTQVINGTQPTTSTAVSFEFTAEFDTTISTTGKAGIGLIDGSGWANGAKYYTDKIVIEEIVPSTEITMNNNGVITTEKIETGAALPTPESDIAGNVFKGWYTDTTWATQVTEVPAEATTLYAKWSTTVIDFNNITSASGINGWSQAKVTEGQLYAMASKNYFINVPAYDAAGVGLYQLENGKNYKVTLSYFATGSSLYYEFLGDVQTTYTTPYKIIASENPTEMTDLSFTFTAVADETVSTTGKATLGLYNPYQGWGSGPACTIDKIVIVEDYVEEEVVEEGVIKSSYRAEDAEADPYQSAAVRFLGRVNDELAASASEIGFVVVPNGYTVDSELAITAVNKNAEKDIVYAPSVPVEGYEAVDGYTDYMVLVYGLTKQGEPKNLCSLELDVYMYVVVDGETQYIGETLTTSYKELAGI